MNVVITGASGSDDDLDAMMAVNLKSALYGMQTIVRISSSAVAAR